METSGYANTGDHYYYPHYPSPYGPSPYYPTPQNCGWICPKCGASNAPHVSQCPCSLWTQPTVTWKTWVGGNADEPPTEYCTTLDSLSHPRA